VSDWVTGWTVTGTVGLIVSTALAVWRRLSPQPDRTPWYVKVAQLGSAIVRLQISEGTLDSMKESLLLEREESAELRADLRVCREENTALRLSIAQLRDSAKTESSGASNAGSTASRTARTPKKPTI
jgi:hypothetical protein